MKHTQYLIFEIATTCNLTQTHARHCPISLPDRYGELNTIRAVSDDAILAACGAAYHRGFAGLIGWHYYCEPMTAWPRLRTLIRRIHETYPQAKFNLTTNGTLFPERLEDWNVFTTIVITEYVAQNWDDFHKALPDVQIIPIGVAFDNRIRNHVQPDFKCCCRPYTELVIDYYGNGHLCCMDFRGEVPLGNIRHEGFNAVCDRFLQVRDLIRNAPMSVEAPDFCQHCAHKQTQPQSIYPPVFDLIQKDFYE